MAIKQGDIVRSNGRIKTIQDDRPRFIEFEAALVIDSGPAGITVNPVGKNAVLLCKPDDLHIGKSAAAQASAPEPKPSGTLSMKGRVSAEKAVKEPEPPPAKKPAPKRRPPAARRRRK